MRFRNDRAFAFGSLVLASAFCLALLVVRKVHSGWSFPYLAWNLFLAWIPFGLSIVVYDRSKRGPGWWLAPVSLLWLLFFPNAPYIVTDLFHLRHTAGAPLWFDVLVYSAFAWTGMALGLISLYLMQSVARPLLGAVRTWLCVGGVLALSSFGIYLGRFVRWNSWDIFRRPTALLGDVWARVADPLHGRTLSVTLVWFAFLTCSYLMLYSFARLAPGESAGRRPRR